MKLNVKIGVLIPQGWFHEFEGMQVNKIRRRIFSITEKAEDLGFDSIWLVDHFYPLLVSADKLNNPVLEAWSLLSSLAVITNKVRLGTMVTCNNYRNPALLAKIASTVDVISNGRLEFGIGAGWYEEEYLAYGYEFPKPKVRIEMLDEAIQIIKLLWTKNKASFQGKYYKIKDAICEPKPIQKPHTPILVGGSGEKYLLRVVAKYANKWNIGISQGLELVKNKMSKLKQYCDEYKTNYDDIVKTCRFNVVLADTKEKALKKKDRIQKILGEEWFRKAMKEGVIGTPEECVKKMREIINAGFTEFVVLCFNDDETYELLGNEVRPKIS